MPIELTITKQPRNVSIANVTQIFTEQGGTIGRGGDNAWVLEDPNRYISSRHVDIREEAGRFYLTDISTNGTFYNGASNPIGNGNRVPLNNGDRFSLGDYEFEVKIRDVMSPSSDPLLDPFSAGPFAEPMPSPGYGDSFGGGMHHDDPFATSPNINAPIQDNNFLGGPEETDPLVLLDKRNPFGGSDHRPNPFITPTQSDHVDPMQQAVSWPSVIPDDWDADPVGTHNSPPQSPIPQPPKRQERQTRESTPKSSSIEMELLARLDEAEKKKNALEAENRRLMAEVASLRQKLKNQPQTAAPTPSPAPREHQRAVNANDRALIEAMGLAQWSLPDQKILEINLIVGELVRETMEGLMQVLGFRKRIKEEFRINVTTIQPVENNPLKFSANIEDAMENMFIKENRAYQRPVDAVREGFQGISEHQVAVLAGIQSAFKGMLERFDPNALEQRFEKYRKAGIVKVGQKGKNWDSYKEFHKDLMDNLDNSFQHLFGYDFVQAYENQLQKLQMSRKFVDKGKEF